MRSIQRMGIFAILILTICLIFTGCDDKKMTLNYADGSGNLYIVQSHPVPHLSYQPIQPASSSSGMYTGGDPVERDLNPADYQALTEKVQAALSNKAVHITDRIKMSGALELQGEGQSVSVILKPGCAEQLALENLLKQLKSQS